MTKQAIHRSTVGARIAIRMHSKDGNVQQLRHDLCNGPAHVFGDHSSCNRQFCKHVEQQSEFERVATPAEEETACDSQSRQSFEGTNDTNQPDKSQSTPLVDQIARIVATELESEPTPEEEEAACTGDSASLSSLPEGLFCKVLSCGDRLVMLAPQLISKLTSWLSATWSYAPSVMEESSTTAFRQDPLSIGATQLVCRLKMVRNGR